MSGQKQVILGTAGHIDHGKTSLVKALSGVDTDRLKEEKERGITIELGFTFLDLPSGIRLGIIDVPGHERFVKHMVAGAWGIDFVALVVAADEGVMPQTREHLDICTLLKVKKGLVILTKIDLVDRELLELVTEEVKEVVKETFLKEAPILPVSSVTGEGIPELMSALDGLASQAEERSSEGLVRLPIDRVFVMKGFGSVVTGTMISGNLSVGETVEILPSKAQGKVRNIQVYSRPVERAVAGQRTAVNLQGVETSAIERGEVLVRPHTLSPTQVIDAYLEYLPSAQRPLKHRTHLRFHTGTALTTASVFLLDRDELVPGEAGWVQFRLDRPLVTLPQDRFVIRTSSTIQTVGGGVILDTQPIKHKRFSPSVAESLMVLRDGTEEQILSLHVYRSGPGGVSLQELAGRVAMSPKDIQTILQKRVNRREVLVVDAEKMKVVAREHGQHLREAILTQLKEFHQRSPMKLGFAKEELRTKLPPEMDVRLFQSLLGELIESGEVVMDKEWLRLSSHRVSAADEKGLIKRIEEALLKAGLQPPSPKELAEAWSEAEGTLQTVFDYLTREGSLVKIKSGMYFHRTPLGQLKEELIAYLRTHQEITTPQFKDITGVSRKFAIPLIEYFDHIKLTLRLGDKRVLRSTAQSSST